MIGTIERFVRLADSGLVTKADISQAESLRRSLSKEEQKQATESRVFVRFAKALKLLRDPFQHDNASPPHPDIHLSLPESEYYFELGEVTDQNLARNISVALKTGQCTGGALSQLDPLDKMLREKCASSYEVHGAPIDLLLYYWRLDPYLPFVQDFFISRSEEIRRLYKASQFDRIWLFEFHSSSLLWRIEEVSGSVVSTRIHSSPIISAV